MNELKKLPFHFIYTWRKFIFASMFVLGLKLVLQNPSSFGRLHHKFQYMFWYNPYSTVSITLFKTTHWYYMNGQLVTATVELVKQPIIASQISLI